MSALAALLSVDWGTTSLRVYLLTADGGVLDEREAPLGIMNIAGGAFAAACMMPAAHGWSGMDRCRHCCRA